MRNAVFFAYLAFTISVGLTGCASRISDSEQFLIFAQEVYFGGPIDHHISAPRKLVRWNQPLRVSIEGPDAARYRDQVAGHLADFTRLTGLQAGLVDKPAEANLTVVLSGDDTYHINGEATSCVAMVQDRDGDVQRVDLRIGFAEAARIELCLAHELYHGFGLRFHSVAAESVLSPVHGKTRPTLADDLALLILYDPRLRPGVAPHEAAATLRELTSQVAGDFGEHWTAILPSESRFEVPPEAVGGTVSRHIRSRDRAKHLTKEIAFWIGSKAPQPVAVAVLVTADPPYFIDNIPSLQDSVAELRTFPTKPFQFGEQSKHSGRYGVMDTIDARFDDTECMGFRQRLGSRPRSGASSDLLIGYICANPGNSLDMRIVGELLQDVKIRGLN